MAFRTYVSHLDARIRETVLGSACVGPAIVTSETAATWEGLDRSVRALLGGDGRITYVLHVGSEAFPYDRFSEELEAPDVASTAEKIAEFFNDGAPAAD